VVEPQEVLAITKSIGTDLAQLLRGIPEELALENIQPGKLCVSGFLHLALHATTAALHRRLLWSIQQSNAKIDPQFVQFIRGMLRTRAHSLVKFLSHLRPEHMEAFWFFAAGGCATILGGFLGLLRTTSVTKEESKELQKLMKEFEWQLRMKAKMSDWVSYTLTRLRALGWDDWKNSKISLPEYDPKQLDNNNHEANNSLPIETDETMNFSPLSSQQIFTTSVDLESMMWAFPDLSTPSAEFPAIDGPN
jgi:hypothetical protein